MGPDRTGKKPTDEKTSPILETRQLRGPEREHRGGNSQGPPRRSRCLSSLGHTSLSETQEAGLKGMKRASEVSPGQEEDLRQRPACTRAWASRNRNTLPTSLRAMSREVPGPCPATLGPTSLLTTMAVLLPGYR